MATQIYNIHLVDGTVLPIPEDYDKPIKEGIVGKFTNAKDDDTLELGNSISGIFYIPRKSILFIATGDVLT